MALFDGKLFDKVDRLVARADRALDKVRKTPRKRLDVVPEPIEAPDPFVKAAADPAADARIASAKAVAKEATDATAALAAAEKLAAAPPPPQEVPLGDAAVAAQIYGKRTDMWSGRAVRLFADLGIDARFINIEDPELVGLEMKLVRDTKQYELPWVFLRGEFIGGYNALDELHRLGKLEERTLPAGERPAQRKSRIRIEAPPAPSEPSSSPPGGARSTGD